LSSLSLCVAQWQSACFAPAGLRRRRAHGLAALRVCARARTRACASVSRHGRVQPHFPLTSPPHTSPPHPIVGHARDSVNEPTDGLRSRHPLTVPMTSACCRCTGSLSVRSSLIHSHIHSGSTLFTKSFIVLRDSFGPWYAHRMMKAIGSTSPLCSYKDCNGQHSRAPELREMRRLKGVH